jgi:hypothetical protein
MGSRSYCRSCGAELLWVQLASGKRMPLDVGSMEQRFIVSGATEPMSGSARRTYLSHFATCPNAEQHRKKEGV